MSRLNLRKQPRVCYYEPEEPPFDEFVFCTECRDYVYEYCSIHGPLLIIPDEKVPAKTGYPDFVPRAALTIPRVFLHLANSNIKDAGIGVFSTLTLPIGVRFGPYRGFRAATAGDSSYAWQIYDKNHKPLHVIDARDDNASNWMRYVNCSRHTSEQNLIAYQYQGQLYYRTIKVIPRFTELLVFYGSEFAATLGIDLRLYSVPCQCYACKARLPMKAQGKRNKRQAQIEEKPREEKIPRKNPVEELTVTSVHLRNDLKTNDDPNVSSAIVTEQPKVNKPKKKKIAKEVQKSFLYLQEDLKNNNNTAVSTSGIPTEHPKDEKPKKKRIGNKSTAEKFEPLIKTSVELDTDKNTIVADVSLNETNLKSANLCHKCDTCSKTFDVKSDLVKHIHTHKLANGTAKQSDAGSKRHKCSYCSYSSNNKTNLTSHIRTHTGEKPFKCNYCDYACNQKPHLTKHIRTHTGEKPFKCNHCDFACIQKPNLTKHIRTHTGEKPFKCNHCDYACNRKDVLTTHIRTHAGEKPFKCDYCDYACAHKHDLTRHIRTHTGEKPFKCNYCDYACNQKHDLTKHIRTHTGEKPFKCNHCDYACIQKQHLTKHMTKHGPKAM